MKTLRQIFVTFALVVGLAFTVSAQRDGDKNRPPKEKPPVVNPGDKGKPPPPKDDKKPKKPGSELALVVVGKDEEIA